MSSRTAIENFAEQYRVTFPVGKAVGVAQELRVETIPETIFVSREGIIVRRISGKLNTQELIAAIEEIVR